MTLFDEYIDEIIKVEGGYVDNPKDSGGPTKYGITERVAKRYGYHGHMSELPLSLAKQIYREEYWDRMSLDEIEAISPSIVKELLDTGINQGVGRAGEYLQTALNVLNREGKDFKDIPVDGDVGPATVRALKQYVWRRGAQGEIVLFRALNCLQGAFYISLAQRRPKDEGFVYGWLLNRVVV